MILEVLLLSSVNILVVPLQELPRWLLLYVVRDDQHFLAVMLIIVLAISIIVMKMSADDEVEVRINRNVATIKKSVDVRPQQ